MHKKLEKYIEELLDSTEEFKDCFIIEIKHEGNQLWVYMDDDEGITLKKCTKISRKLESFIEENGLLAEKYRIEVSSPGLSNPLKLKRQYKKNIGRTLRVKRIEAEEIKGKLTLIDEDGIKLTVPINKKEAQELRIDWGNIQSSYVVATF